MSHYLVLLSLLHVFLLIMNLINGNYDKDEHLLRFVILHKNTFSS